MKRYSKSDYERHYRTSKFLRIFLMVMAVSIIFKNPLAAVLILMYSHLFSIDVELYRIHMELRRK